MGITESISLIIKRQCVYRDIFIRNGGSLGNNNTIIVIIIISGQNNHYPWTNWDNYHLHTFVFSLTKRRSLILKITTIACSVVG